MAAIENPASGVRVKWHLTAADTDGALLRFELWVPPGGAGPHADLHTEERFELMAGTMGLERGNERLELTRGQRATVPPGVARRWGNAGDDELHVMVEVAPALEVTR